MGGHLTREEKKAWKESILESRLDDFIILKDWLKAEKIEFENNDYFIIVKDIIIEFDLKVAFSAGRKKYQYNIEGIKKRLQKN
jgi:hypothetical protein